MTALLRLGCDLTFVASEPMTIDQIATAAGLSRQANGAATRGLGVEGRRGVPGVQSCLREQ